MSPLTLLPTDATQSFKKFYNVKYNKVVSQDHQPLLRISNANKHHFLFAPISSNSQDFGRLSRKEFLAKRTLFIPELVELEPVPGSLWREIQMLPFVIERISAFIKIGEFRQSIDDETTLGLVQNEEEQGRTSTDLPQKLFHHLICQKTSTGTGLPSIHDFREAFTLTGAGELFDLERFEILGDAFLKFSVSLSLFLNSSIARKNEGCLTQYRSMLVGNKNLLNCARSKNFDRVLSARRFEPHLCWLPPRLKQTQDMENILCSWDEEFRQTYFSGEKFEEEKEKLPSATLFHTMTPLNLTELLQTGFNASSKEKLFKEARRLLRSNELPGRDRLCPRQNVLISDKSFADSAEALIGVFLARLGQAPALEFMSWLGLDLAPDTPIDVLIQSVKSRQNSSGSQTDTTKNVVKRARKEKAFNWFLGSESFPADAVACERTFVLEDKMQGMKNRLDIEAIEKVLGYNFREKTFIIQAFTHASYSPNRLTDSYEQLEFLGDAVIDYLVTCHLYTSTTEQMSPGQITDVRSALVNNNTLASICVGCKFHKHLLFLSPPLLQMINTYLDFSQSDETATDKDDKTQQLILNLELNNEADCPTKILKF